MREFDGMAVGLQARRQIRTPPSSRDGWPSRRRSVAGKSIFLRPRNASIRFISFFRNGGRSSLRTKPASTMSQSTIRLKTVEMMFAKRGHIFHVWHVWPSGQQKGTKRRVPCA